MSPSRRGVPGKRAVGAAVLYSRKMKKGIIVRRSAHIMNENVKRRSGGIKNYDEGTSRDTNFF